VLVSKGRFRLYLSLFPTCAYHQLCDDGAGLLMNRSRVRPLDAALSGAVFN